MIIFTSDNGGADYIELEDINKPYRGWKISFFEGGIRVPYILSWPDEISPAQESNSAVHHFDIFSTIASAAGFESSELNDLDGVNLLPFINYFYLQRLVSNQINLSFLRFFSQYG